MRLMNSSRRPKQSQLVVDNAKLALDVKRLALLARSQLSDRGNEAIYDHTPLSRRSAGSSRALSGRRREIASGRSLGFALSRGERAAMQRIAVEAHCSLIALSFRISPHGGLLHLAVDGDETLFNCRIEQPRDLRVGLQNDVSLIASTREC